MRIWYIIFILIAAQLALAETYHIRDDGTASKSGAAESNGGSCSDASKAMSVSTHNSASFSPGDTIYICGVIDDSGQLVPPSSGSTEGFITYRGDYPGHAGSLEQEYNYPNLRWLISIVSKEYLAFESLNFNGHRTNLEGSFAGIWIEGLEQQSSHIKVNDCDFAESVNGIFIRGNSHYIEVTGCTFRDMTSHGIHFGTYYNHYEVGMPSHIIVGGSREDGNEFVNCGFLGCQDYKSCEECVNNVCLKGDSSGSVPGSALGEQATDVVISYNHMYSDKDKWGGGGIYNQRCAEIFD